MGTVGYVLLVALIAAQATQEHARTVHVFVALCDNKHQKCGLKAARRLFFSDE